MLAFLSNPAVQFARPRSIPAFFATDLTFSPRRSRRPSRSTAPAIARHPSPERIGFLVLLGDRYTDDDISYLMYCADT